MKMLQEHAAKILNDATGIEAVDVTSAVHWFIAEDRRMEIDCREDFPSIVPPWPFCWLEFSWPDLYREGENTFSISGPLRRLRQGAIFNGFEVIEADRDAILRNDVVLKMLIKRHERAQELVTPTYVAERKTLLDGELQKGETARWIITCDMATERQGGGVVGLVSSIYALNEDGRLIVPSIATYGSGSSEVFGLLSPFWFSFSLMHCKNVKSEDVAVPQKVMKAREKRGIPNITFKTLVVEPLRQQIRREAAADPTGEQNHIKRALHIARGHFKDYRDGPGLFGKYQGLYWWDMHVRGRAEAGVVVKDYQVKR